MENKFIYHRRIIDEILENKLKTFAAIYVKGLRWCGKSTSAKQIAKSFIKVDLKTKQFLEANLYSNDSIILDGQTPRLIDEWQIIPRIWDIVRNEIDNRKHKTGQFILTGSSIVDNTEINHSGIGRIYNLTMRTMSLYESNDSNGLISLKELFDQKPMKDHSTNVTLLDIANYICYGGWPIFFEINKSLDVAKDYINHVINNDFLKITKNKLVLSTLLKTYARNVGTIASNDTMIKDINCVSSISKLTFTKYLNLLNDLFLIEEVEPFLINLRSRQIFKNAKKRFFTDPSIGTAIMNIKPEMFIQNSENLKLMGQYFEALCFRDLRTYIEKLNGNIYYFRDKNGLEVDCIIYLDDTRYALIEFKLTDLDDNIISASKNINKLKQLMIDNNWKPPSFCAIIVGVGSCWTTKDNILVIPITSLKD